MLFYWQGVHENLSFGLIQEFPKAFFMLFYAADLLGELPA